MPVSVVASSRGVFSAGAKTLTIATPAGAVKGDTIVAIVAHNGADSYNAFPAGWVALDSIGSGADSADVFSRMVDDNEPTSVVFSLFSVANEWQGETILLRGTSPGAWKEARASTTFAATTSLTVAAAMCQQAIDLILVAWSCSGSPTLTLPAGFTSIDNFATAVVSSRSMLIGWRAAGATSSVSISSATASANTTGRSYTFTARDRPPLVPSALVDLVPGNIGLIGRDTRRAR